MPSDKLTKILKDTQEFPFSMAVGIELEGGWIEKPRHTVHSDGSVSCEGNYKGESHTEPANTIKGICLELEAKYPDLVDLSCGMHVHVSLPNLYYAMIATKKFHDYFLERMETLKEYIKQIDEKDYNNLCERLKGNNRYCKGQFLPEKQIISTNKTDTRYTMLNYCHGLHKTLECRVFPMFFNSRCAAIAAYEFMDIIKSFLEEKPEKTSFSIAMEIPIDSDEEEFVKLAPASNPVPF